MSTSLALFDGFVGVLKVDMKGHSGIFIVSEITSFFWQLFANAIRGNTSIPASILRRWLYRTQCHIDTHVFIRSRSNAQLGLGSALYHGCYILNTNGKFILGSRSHLGAFCYVNVCQGKVLIGNDVAIGPGTRIFAFSNHYAQGDKVIDTYLTKDVIIGDNIFIGANCTILPGTEIEDNVVIAAGSVVKGKLGANALYAGVPCKLIEKGWYG